MRSTRRLFLGWTAAAVTALAGCAAGPQQQASADPQTHPPIVFVHGNGDTAALWMTTIWRFESNGWPRDRLHAIELPYPLARDDDAKAQPGRTSTGEHMAFLKSEVEKVLQRTGARQVVLVGNSRGGNAIRNYIDNGGGSRTVSHAILGGTPNHGVWATPGWRDGSEFAGHGVFLSTLNKPKNAAGDEVIGPVKWMTIRSENNDLFAQPDGKAIGRPGPTNVTHAGPELKGAKNVVIPKIDHRETSYSPEAFEAMYTFITGRGPATVVAQSEGRVSLSGKVTGLGLSPTDPASGNFQNNLPLPGAQLQVFAINPENGERRGAPVYSKTIGADGAWGPLVTDPGTLMEFVVSAPGYATTHIYRSRFPRSSSVVNIRATRIVDADKDAPAVVTFSRPRGYFDAARDKMTLDGQMPAGVPAGATLASAKIKPAATPRPVIAEFNGERIVGRVWPAAEGHVTILEVTN